MPYCVPADLVLGDAQLPTGMDLNKVIQDAMDEIDSKIGFRYHTPVATTATDFPRPVLLLLKRLNAHLASGRIILAANISGEKSELHAYGAYLVREVERSLKAIADGSVDLPIPLVEGTVVHQRAPLVANVDAASQVEAFYGALTNPLAVAFPTPYRSVGG